MGEVTARSFSALNSSYDKAFDKFTWPSSPSFAKWPDEELAELIARNPDTATARLAASEIRRREAWRTPARFSLVVAILALIVSAVALGRTF
ncbi:hypothetical protein [Sphingobium tyrosinilyticum]|uniref:Uncharacterized protein n=1 Tax=Sphingobium tyrosinilyticum TaxID=2715436 RepID=A0ABV9EYJ0_9SPHN